MMKKWLCMVMVGMLVLGGCKAPEEATPTPTPTPTPAITHTIHYDGYTLDKVVVLSRHSIRSPMSGAGSALSELTPHTWIDWTSNPSALSLRGGVLETEMGQYFRKWLEEEGLFPEDYQPSKDEVRLYANSKQRTIATTTAFLSGLLPISNLDIEYHAEFDTMDPVFNPQLTFVSDSYNKQAQEEIQTLFQKKIESLKDNYDILGQVIDYKDSKAYKDGSFSGFVMDDTEVILEKDQEPMMSGSLKTATSLSDALVLQYYESSDDVAAFGKSLDYQQWSDIGEIKDVYQEVLFTAPLIATNVAHPLLQEIKNEIQKEGRKFTYLCGHDSNLGSVLSSLRVTPYILNDAIEKTTPIGSKVVFSCLKDKDGNDYVSIDMVYQTINQLRGLSLLDTNNPPALTHLYFEDLEVNEDGLYRLEDIEKRFQEAIDAYDAYAKTEEKETVIPAPITNEGRVEDNAIELLPKHIYSLNTSHEIEGREGIAASNEFYYNSDTATLTKYDLEWNAVASNKEPFKGIEAEVNRIGDIAYFNNEIYASVQYTMDGITRNPMIAIYDAETLKLKKTYPIDPTSEQEDISGIAIDETNNSIWLASSKQADLYQYNLEDGTYIGKKHLLTAPSRIQGIANLDGWLYITADDGVADEGEVDHMYRVKIDLEQTSWPVVLERSFDDVSLQGEIDGLVFLPESGQVFITYNKGQQIINDIPQGYYEGYDHEIHEVYIYDYYNAR